ncbi:protein STRUBBELIG-RECEPTOR FAMILY 1 isoform X2 [Arachis hypogaea]|uniref:protein STRUBBELIG-RECEPTOR FAMILY 1 isoform X2 n=2 Tax=Arachis TaxID=3817 RepID=UPI000DED8F8E|nr:protein STRUBBELIG-RECEPTOR FAMILY 3 isoform X2 [Arachis hypogaea]
MDGMCRKDDSESQKLPQVLHKVSTFVLFSGVSSTWCVSLEFIVAVEASVLETLPFEEMGCTNLVLHVRLFVTLMVILAGTFCAVGDTDVVDVAAISSLYVALGSPPLLGWKPVGGDPCFEMWQGVGCVFSNITSIRLDGLNLGGELGSNLNFPSILEIDLSNNHIGGPIPFTLPPTLTSLSLSGNQLNGSIPDALSLLTQLSHLDLSNNNLSGQLPSSTGTLSSLTTLYLQNNQLSGTLYVLQDLPLQDLNIENNSFSGPIPPKLLSVPIFRKDGNPFNTSVIPSPAAAPSPAAMAPSPGKSPWRVANSPSSPTASMLASARKSFIAKNIIWIAGAGLLIFILLGVCIFMLWCFKRRPEKKNAKKQNVSVFESPLHKPTCSDTSFEATNQEVKVEKPSLVSEVLNRKTNLIPKVQDEQGKYVKTASATSQYNHGSELINTSEASKLSHLQPPPRPYPMTQSQKLILNPAIPAKGSEINDKTCSLEVYSIASLQQYTNSFSQENFIGEGTLGPVYRAEFPDGKILAVRKLDATASMEQNHEQFLQLVSNISKIQHPNIVKFTGYCTEYSQRLLVYEYCSNGTLHDALHGDSECRIRLTWNARIQVALGAARALEYMHENFRPPIVHRNFKSANVLLNDNLEVCISDCGLGPLLSSGSAGQLSGRLLTAYGYSAPEFEFGSYTHQSDVFSFGVVMLELLTGRKSHDRSLPRGEQILVRWAVPQLHDIDALSKMVDPSLNGAYPMKSLSRFADIVSSCVQHEPEFRPAMSEVVQDLLRMM